MIATPTVLVLGAGASVHVEYPLGKNLVNDLCRNSDGFANLPMNWTDIDVGHFLTRLSRAGHYSIDAFLETVPDQSDLGKYLIAREMKRHENIDRLFPPYESGWFQYLFNCLLENNKVSGFDSSRLSIITFNYDRSLEAYLHEALMARFEMPSDEASSILSQIPIIHVHGSLGQYPDIPYVSKCEANELLEISKQIQIIHQVQDLEDEFCNHEFEQANKLLNEAERIFFLGFGFHPDNIDRFRFFSPNKIDGCEIYATTSGMGPMDREELISRLEPLGFKQNAFVGNRCNDFFTHVATLQ